MLEKFFKDSRPRNALLAFLVLSSVVIPFPTPLAQAMEIPLSPTIPPTPSMEKSEEKKKPEESLEQTVSKIYNLPVEEFIAKTRGILRTETRGETDNPMQVNPETAKESLKDFEKRIGTEKLKEILGKMNPEQKKIFEGQITFARYYQMAQHTFEKFPEQTRKDLALVYYNGGPGFTGKMMAFWSANNPGVDVNKTSWQSIATWLSKNSDRIESAYQLAPGRVASWTKTVNTYVWRANLLSDPNVPREKAFTKK